MLTVTDEAPSPDLTTSSEVSIALGIADYLDPTLVTAASAAVAAYCNRVLVEEGLQETFRLNHGESVLMLSRYPVTEVDAVVECGITLAATDFEIDPTSGIASRIRSGRNCCWAPGTITFNYIAGYSPQTVPPDIALAVIMLVAHYRSIAARDPLLRAEEVRDIERLEYFIPSTAGLPSPVEALLANHRKPAGA